MTKYQTGKEKKHWQYLKKRAGVCEKRSHIGRVRCWAKLSPASLLFHSCKMGRSSHLVPHGHRCTQRTERSHSVTQVFAHYLYFAIVFILGLQSPPTSVCCFLLRNAHCRKWLSGQENKKKVVLQEKVKKLWNVGHLVKKLYPTLLQLVDCWVTRPFSNYSNLSVISAKHRIRTTSRDTWYAIIIQPLSSL